MNLVGLYRVNFRCPYYTDQGVVYIDSAGVIRGGDRLAFYNGSISYVADAQLEATMIVRRHTPPENGAKHDALDNLYHGKFGVAIPLKLTLAEDGAKIVTDIKLNALDRDRNQLVPMTIEAEFTLISN